MNIRIAYNTLRAFDAAVRHDQGGTWRQLLARVMPHIGDAYRGEEDGYRTHMGASLLGRKCDRELWYSFNWATKNKFDGRMLRLFNRGHMEEGRTIALMLAAGWQVFQQDENGKQFRISEFGGHFGGSGDGVVIGVPDAEPGQPILSEFKTHGVKSFAKLAGANWGKFHDHIVDPVNNPAVQFEGEGVREAKFEHWVQMQTYMRKMGIAAALYLAISKDTDYIYAEIVLLEAQTADNMIARAGRIIPIRTPPAMINKSPGWYECRFCDHKPVCKEGAEPERNCRTCHHSAPNMEDGTWRCHHGGANAPLSKETQLVGCTRYEKNNTL